MNQVVPVVLLAPVAALVALCAVVLTGRWRLERLARRNRVRIAALGDDTGRDPESGAVHSIQTATITTPTARLDAIWSPRHLERFARAYWQYMERFSLNLIRVRYDDEGRYVCLLHRRLCVLGFGVPEYEFGGDRAWCGGRSVADYWPNGDGTRGSSNSRSGVTRVSRPRATVSR